MGFFDRLGNGWNLGMTSMRVIRENMSLLFFPVMSTTALILIMASFFGGIYAAFGRNMESWLDKASGDNEILGYGALFVFYLIAYFIIVFFNVGLVHCARLIFEGKEATVRDGLDYSASRVTSILSWALLAATVGVVLKALEDRLGFIGKLVISLVGMVWSLATFFVVPVIAYENVGPVEALKRSAGIMKEKWGESLGANFSFALFYLLGYPLIIGISIVLAFTIHPFVGMGAALLSLLALHAVVEAARNVFIAAAYSHLAGEPAGQFDDGTMLDNLFYNKR